MKKLLTLSNVIKLAGVVFGLVAFFLMFGNQLFIELLGNRGYVEFSDAMFGDYGSIITFFGYLLIFLASAGACALVFVKVENRKIIYLVLAGVLLLGAIFVFIEAAVVNGRTDANLYHLAACPVIAGIFAIVAALALAASEFVPDKQLL